MSPGEGLRGRRVVAFVHTTNTNKNEMVILLSRLLQCTNFLRSQGCELDLKVHSLQRSSLISKCNHEIAPGLFLEILAIYMLSTNGLLISGQV